MQLVVVLCLWCGSDITFPEQGINWDDPPSPTEFAQRIEALTGQIDQLEQKNDPEQVEELSEMYGLRGMYRFLSGDQGTETLLDLEMALRLNPQNTVARQFRAAWYDAAGDSVRAQADRQHLIDGLNQHLPSPLWVGDPSAALTPAIAWFLVAGFWIVLTLLFAGVGWPQTQEASASVKRLIGVSAALAVLGSLPAAALALHTFRRAVPTDWSFVAVGAICVGVVSLARFIKPPVILVGSRRVLPRVKDEQLLQRVATLATRMHVPVPIVRLWPSTDGTQKALAFAGTIQAPQLVVSDGIVQRLDADECDAIIAHELAHIANGSLWLLGAVVPAACAAVVLVLPLMPGPLAITFGMAFLVGARRLFSRPVELDCDLRAARAIGFRTTINALAKIHAVHWIRSSGLLARLIHGTSTHPSRDTRLAALYDAAPPEDRPDAPPDRSFSRAERNVAIVALVVWGLLLSGTLAFAARGELSPWLAVALGLVALFPIGLLIIANWRAASLSQKRLGRRWLSPGRLTAIAVIALALTAILILKDRPPIERRQPGQVSLASVLVPIVMLSALGGLGIWWIAGHRRRRLLRDVQAACQVHDFRGIVAICRQEPDIVRRSPVLRYNQAVAEAVCGAIPTAVTALEQLWADNPKFPLTGLALCTYHLELNRPERVIEIAQALAKSLPGDPTPACSEARAWRRLGRLDEAEAACRRSLQLEPENGSACGIAALIALDRGDAHNAAELCAQGLAFSPGETFLRIVEAEIAISQADLETAQAAVDRARDSIAANPLAVLSWELSRLDRLLTDRTNPVLEEDIFLH